MTAVAVLLAALARGGKVVWDPTERPRLLAPPSLHEAIKADRETVKEILRRATIFREQVTRPGPWLILTLPHRQEGEGCLSCGVAVRAGDFRCELCALAVTLALEGRP